MREIENYKTYMDETTISDEMKQRLMNLSVQTVPKQNMQNRKWVAAVACLCLIFSVSGIAYAAYHYLSMSQVAGNLDNKSLEQVFKDEAVNYVNETKECGEYSVTLIGTMSTAGLEKSKLKGNYEKNQWYSVLAIKKKNNEKMHSADLEKPYCVTPIIEGMNPLKVNSYTMQGSMEKTICDGVLYILYSQNDIACFANKSVKLEITDGKEVDAIFDLSLDPKYADAKKADSIKQFWSDATINESASKLKVSTLYQSKLDKDARNVLPAFENEVCVVSESMKAAFFTKEGEKIATCKMSEIMQSGCVYLDAYSTPNYLVIKCKESEKYKFAIINRSHQLEKVVELDEKIKIDILDEIMVCPEQQRIVFERVKEQRKDSIYEICSCDYDSKDLKVLYKVKDMKPESLGKMDDISDMRLSQDGTTIFLSGLYFDSLETGSSAKNGMGYINLETGKLRFIHGGNDEIAGVTADRALYYTCSGTESGKVIILNKEGKQKTISLKSASELPYLYISRDGKRMYSVVESESKGDILKCYNVDKNICEWTKAIGKGKYLRDVVDTGKVLAFCDDENAQEKKIVKIGSIAQ